MTAAVAEPIASDTPLLQVRELDKHFGPVQALYHVDLALPNAQVTALCGDNGAGKSVLTKTISGVYIPDHGQDLIERLRDRGLAVMVISHNLNDVFEVADGIAVMYLGRLVVQDSASKFDRQSVVEYMTPGGRH